LQVVVQSLCLYDLRGLAAGWRPLLFHIIGASSIGVECQATVIIQSTTELRIQYRAPRPALQGLDHLPIASLASASRTSLYRIRLCRSLPRSRGSSQITLILRLLLVSFVFLSIHSLLNYGLLISIIIITFEFEIFYFN